MTTLPESISWYETRAEAVADSYEAVQPEQLHGWLDGLHPPALALILDVGAVAGATPLGWGGWGMT